MIIKIYFVIIIVGGDNTKETPDPIPNSEVKLRDAEGSRKARIGNCRLFNQEIDQKKAMNQLIVLLLIIVNWFKA